jgi:transposase
MASAVASDDLPLLQRQLLDQAGTIAALQRLNLSLQGQIDALQRSLVTLANENKILLHRLVGSRSERLHTSELQLALGDLLDQQKALQKQLDTLQGQGSEDTTDPASPPAPPPVDPPRRPSPKGRRDLSASSLPRVVVKIDDPELARQGKVIGFDSSYQLMFIRGGFKVLEQRTLKYEIPLGQETTVLGATVPPTLFPRSLLHASTIAHLAVEKFALGVPHYRLEKHLADQGEGLDRGTMSRAMEGLGNTLAATIVEAMRQDTLATCQVLSTDATGAAIQPGPLNGGPSRPCRRGHFFAVVADQDHVMFFYVKEHTQTAVADLFRGFSGYVQSDASSVYHLLERGPIGAEEDGRKELVGCWAHARRGFYEAALCKYPVGLEGLVRIGAMYAADEPLKKLPPSQRQAERQRQIKPLIDDFFAWVHRASRTQEGRTLAAKALGYARNQEEELRRVLRDPRLPLDNTRSERALKKVVVGRKAWMFYGSDVHAEAAAGLFTMIASCRLHRLDPEQYLEEVQRVLVYWPRERYLELAPKNWLGTRARLDEAELRRPAGAIKVPPPE